MGCFSNDDQPTYTPPAPPTLATASDLYNQAQSFYQNNGYGGLLTAQQTALNNANNPNYYSQFQPTSFEQALGNQSFQNVWPDEQAAIMNQLSKSGMANSPVAATTVGNAYGNLATNIGEYLDTQANNRASGAINAGLQISPSQLLTPFVQTGQTQSNDQASANYSYQQALAQQQYQQQMNSYQQQQGLAQMLGYVSPVAGNIYNATQGNLGSGLSGSFNALQQFGPALMSGGFGSLGGGPSSSNALTLSGMAQNSANTYNPGLGSSLGTGSYNQESSFGDTSMKSGLNNVMGV